MKSKVMIGVMGPGENATPEENELAYDLGAAIAKQGWVVLSGGREFGVMNAALKGASDNNGLTVAVLPGETTKGASSYAQIKIITGMGSARNNINALSSHVLVVLGMAAGTASEVSLALRANKKVILLAQDEISTLFFKKIGTYKVVTVSTIEDTIKLIKDYVSLNQIR
ncbi:MAG: TIGR00725 family protein [Cyclobacteriaceae bacterium]|nr:TIGR00725 family protein [Cyclobacteriaceae bacterium]